MRKALVCTSLLAATLVCSAASAMSLRSDLAVIAFSKDGTSALVQIVVRGPEGGGQIAYELWSASGPARQRYELSSDLSPGDGSTPQAILPKACTERLAELGKELARRGFRGVTVQPGQCGKRGNLVTVDKKQLADVADAAFQAKGNKLQHGDLEVRFRGNNIDVLQGEERRCSVTQPARNAPAEIHVSGTKSGKLVYLIQQVGDGDEGLLGLCGAGPDGVLKLLSLKGDAPTAK